MEKNEVGEQRMTTEITSIKAASEKIEKSLMTQLKQKKLVQEHYKSIIRDYVALWITKEMLLADITTRGVSVKYDNGGGQSGYKKNDSIAELVKVNSSMLKILSELGLRGADVKIENDEETL